jgi:hypothetical protein
VWWDFGRTPAFSLRRGVRCRTCWDKVTDITVEEDGPLTVWSDPVWCHCGPTPASQVEKLILSDEWEITFLRVMPRNE